MYVRAVVDGVTIQSILTVGDEVGTYEMVGYPEENRVPSTGYSPVSRASRRYTRCWANCH